MRKMFIRSLVAASFLAGAGGIAAGATAAGASAPPAFAGSSWTVTFNWTGFGTGVSTWTFNSNHTVTTPGWPGPITWTKTGSKVKVVYQTDPTLGYVCHATYKGTKTGHHMSGTMHTDHNHTFCLTTGVWHATKTTSARTGSNSSRFSPSGRI